MLNIDFINLKSTSLKDVKKIVKTNNIDNTVNGSNENNSFKDIINNVNKSDTRKTVKEKEKSESKIVEDKTLKNTEVAGKVKDIIEKIENNDGDISEEIIQLLALLNISVVDNMENLVDIPLNTESVLEIISQNDDNSLGEEFINLILENTNENSALENLLNRNDFKEVLQKFESEIEKILPLIKNETGEEISKETIIAQIKNLLVNEEVEPKINVVQTVNENVVVKENFINTESSNNTNLSYDNENTTEIVSEDDSILSKLAGETETSFSKALNNIQVRGQISNGNIAEPVTVYKSNMENDIIKNVKFMIRNSVQELKVKIYPKELGEMTIKILSEEGIMRAEIKATSKETYNLLNSNINEIKKAISNENIKIQDVEIALYNEDTTYFSGDNQRDNRDNRSRMSNSIITEKVEEIILDDSGIEESDIDYLV